jgi:hypothetical protein
MNVKLIRMVSGEEVLAQILEEGDSGLVVKNPAIILPAGQGRLALVPWLPYAETEGMYLASKVYSFMVVPKTDLLNEYNSMFGSGLVLPPKELATPKLVLSE